MINRFAVENIKLHEGFSQFAYKCPAGRTTIAYGRNIDKNGGVGVSRDEAEYLLANDIFRINLKLIQSFPRFTSLDNVRQAALIDMAYNIGLGGLRGFKKMIKAMVAGDYETAANEMLDSRWANQVGSRATKLSQMIRTGEQND